MPVQKIQIELERSSGVFYAGDVVRGVVRLKATGDVTCRGFHLKLVGKSRVHWHTGSGDNRQDYDGTTIFQEQRQVLLGNFFKTGCLDEAGNFADFDQIHNLGVVTIPCDDTSNLTLIVRVMDYDWGKRDDLLGEISVNASQLLQSAQIQSFPLTRRGKPEQGEVRLSAKLFPYKAMFLTKSASGVAVTQDIIKRHCLVVRVHQATGLRKADFVGRNDVYVQVYEATEPVLPGKALPKPDKKTILPQLETIFPFACQLRTDAPGSAELRVGDRSYVRYYVRAYADFANWRDPCCQRHITVIANRPLPNLRLLGPHTAENRDQPIHNCDYCGCKCCQLSGLISVKLQLDRVAYAPGEKVDLTGSQIVNDSNSNLMAWLELKMHVIMRTARNFTARRSSVVRIYFLSISPNTTIQLDKRNTEGLENIKIPAVFPSFYGGVPGVPNFRHYPCLRWTYTLELKVGFPEGRCKGSVKAVTPVLISAAAPYEESIERARASSSDVPDNYWLIFQNAIVGPEACHTCPIVTGPEDGGTTINAHNTGPMSFYDPYLEPEDKGTLQQEPAYQPIVNSFNGPFSMALETHPGTYTDDHTLTTAATASSWSAASGGGTDLSKLLMEMDTSLDHRCTVGEWAKDHAFEAGRLTPSDFETILSKVSFSLDQPAVVGELIAHASGQLSCAHVVAAMRVCKYQKVEVAQIMAPQVKDPENKQLVLNEIEFEYERKMVDFTPKTYEFC